MATASDIAAVRDNTNEPTAERFSDEAIGLLIDVSGVTGSTAIIWRRKAGMFSEMVDTSEAGASRKLSDLSKNATAMAKTWEEVLRAEEAAAAGGKARARTHRIERI